MESTSFDLSQLMVLVALGGVALIALVMALLAFVGGAAWFVRRGAGANPKGHAEMLSGLGYMPAGDDQWAIDLPQTKLVFTNQSGWRWSVQLPRYNTLTLEVVERLPGVEAPPGAFDPRNPELANRFYVSSKLPAQTIALLGARKVSHAMLAMPYLSLALRGDELVIDDAQCQSLARMLGTGAVPGTSQTLDAEAEVHQAVLTLVTAILGTLYSRLTGTLLPEHR
ncbi:MAG: hypothetical protein KTR31_07635 [Myxococcales bacterium]|nr:hypothetical protein [Myxococcales bacterium]